MHLTALNSTRFERNYLSTKPEGSISRSLAKLWLRVFGTWLCQGPGTRNEKAERPLVDKYNDALEQLVAQTAKTQIQDSAEELAKYGIQYEPGEYDRWNSKGKRFTVLKDKVQAFYVALKGRVEQIAPHDSARQAKLYQEGLQELTDKIAENPAIGHGVANYLKGKLLRESARADLVNKVTPIMVAEHKLKCLADAVDCFVKAFAPHESRKLLCNYVRKEIMDKHAEKFEAHIDELACGMEAHIEERRKSLDAVINDAEGDLYSLEDQIKQSKLLLKKERRLRREIQKLQHPGFKNDKQLEILSKKQKELENEIRRSNPLSVLKKDYREQQKMLLLLKERRQHLGAQEEENAQRQLDYLTLFTTDETADNDEFYELTYPE